MAEFNSASKSITIEGCSYRCSVIPTVDNSVSPRNDDSNSKERNINENNNFVDVTIEQDGTSAYKHTFRVPKAFHRFIIGREGENLRRLQTNTNTAIRTRTNDNIVIFGDDLESVVSARHEIYLLMKNSRSKLRPTHFISIPMIDETLSLNFLKFKEIVLNDTAKHCKSVRDKIFQKPERMHLTLGMLTFIDEDEVEAGIEAFYEYKEIVVKPIIEKHGPIKIRAQGLGSFQENLAQIRVLYGTISTENDVLQELANKTAEFFVEKGMMKKEGDKVSLHMTLINSSFAIDRSHQSYQPIKSFNATSIMKAHKDQLFGEILLSTIHICSLAGPITADGYYEITAKILV